MKPAIPRNTKSATSTSGMRRTISSLRSTKLPSISGCIMAAKSGSVAAKASMATIETVNIRQ